MIKLGTAAFNLKVKSLSADELKDYNDKLFDLWEEQVASELADLHDYSLYLIVEEGSLKGLGKTSAALGVVYVAISSYGSFVQGVQLLNSHIRIAVSFLNQKSLETIPEDNLNHIFRTGTGKLGKLEGLFKKVQRGEVEPEVAATRAERTFRDDAQECPEFIASFLDVFNNQLDIQAQMELHPDVLSIQVAPVDADRQKDISPGSTPSHPHQDRPPDKYKVEVWRKSK